MKAAYVDDQPGVPGTSIVLEPPVADPGVTDDERRTIAEMMAKGIYAGILLARSSRSRPSSRTAFATAPSAIPRAT